MFNKKYLRFIRCPSCGGNLKLQDDNLVCPVCREKFETHEGILVLLPNLTNRLELFREKWEEYHHLLPDNLDKLREDFETKFLSTDIKYLKECVFPFKGIVYLEVGCGSFLTGVELAKLGAFVIGLDFSLKALKTARYFLDEAGIKDYLLIHGDIRFMPIKENTCDLLYGAGVIEHVRDTQALVSEIYRVLKKGGVALSTVPLLNLGSLTYRQVWGNIPNLPLLKQLAEFVHIRLLQARHMRFGYELSFTQRQMRKIFEKAHFQTNKIEIGKFNVLLFFEYIKFSFLKKLAAFLVSHIGFFWPMMYIKAEK